MTFDQLKIKQKEVIKMLENSFKKHRLVHAYLFCGDKGIGKLLTGFYFAAMVLCKSNHKPCLECSICRRVINRSHMNVYFVEPEGESIKKDQIEDLQHEFSMTSLEEGARIYIINHADKMTPSAGNSLLKFLEEPIIESYAILITENVNNVLDTIKSRSQIINFKKVSRLETALALQKRGLSIENSHVFATLTSSVEEALEYAATTKLQDLVRFVREMNIACTNKKRPKFVFFNERGKFLMEEKDRSIHKTFLDLLIVYAQDMISYSENHLDAISFKTSILDLNKQLLPKSERLTKELDIYIEAKERLEYNVNIDLFYAKLFLDLDEE
jgi:DNA polymerase-3 subunit delta'